MSEMLDRVIVAISSEMGQHPKNAVCERAARAVLEAMREPTEPMFCAGDEHIIAALNDHGGVRRDPTPAQGAWQAMINEALRQADRDKDAA